VELGEAIVSFIMSVRVLETARLPLDRFL